MTRGKFCGAGRTGLVKEHAAREHTIAELFSVSQVTVCRVLRRTQGQHPSRSRTAIGPRQPTGGSGVPWRLSQQDSRADFF
ncbi:hypothetical protein ACF09H_15040 [Streptomyces sp. NPDC014983]|uniref:hypothetical protein n=1 Tax=Streptomyces sp. NPDC014983 TaxID=3364933 RepID=UPI003700735B